MKDAYKRVTFRGKTVNKRTAAALLEAEHRLGYELTVVQGSYNGGSGSVSQSAGTHDGGGAVDLAPYDWERKVTVLRKIGWAAWHRPAISGLWGEHIHAGLKGDRQAAAGLVNQFRYYAQGLSGLADHAPDPFQPHPSTVFRYWLWRKTHPKLRAVLDKLPTV